MNYVRGVRCLEALGAILVSVVLTACGSGSASSPSPMPASPTAPTTPVAPTVTVTSVTATCSPATLAAGATSQCSATVQGTGAYSSAVGWSASSGSIDATGKLTTAVTAGATVVTATSVQDPSKSGIADVTAQLTIPAIRSVVVTCTPSVVNSGMTSQCTAMVHGSGAYSSAVSWSASSGSITPGGLFVAPATAAQVIITATSVEDGTKVGQVKVNVQAPSSTITAVAVVCSPATLFTGATAQCTASVQGTGAYNSSVTWSSDLGTVNALGQFVAPSTAGEGHVTATSTQDSAKGGSTLITVQLQTPKSTHVVMVMEENTGYGSVVNNTNAWPNLNHLISNGALPTNYYSDSHPSIGNYFMLTTGALLTTNDSSTAVWDVDSIARRMLASGVSFRVYAEGITQGYLGGNTGTYLLRHNPFAMLSDIASDPTIANQVIWPFSQFAADLAAGTLPAFSFIVPDVNDDAHNGTPQQADAWLNLNVVTPLAGSPAFSSTGDGLLIVDFDEAATSDTTHGGGHVAPVLWGPIVKVGYTQTSTTLYQHESMLRTIMDALQLANPPAAATAAPSMAEFFLQP